MAVDRRTFVLRLDADDNTAAFRADATFHRVAGLADAGWTSFRSHNFPDRQDATFRLTP